MILRSVGVMMRVYYTDNYDEVQKSRNQLKNECV